ncbi:hypothetical protein K439DRAFT_1612514 [Ramaria rubella]|nr:hypothetical protein K439DRAFT_1612514 [Ramaria rubella]
MTQPPSTAQQCNEDVLSYIFSLASKADVARSARVCKQWLPVTRRALYRDLTFDAKKPSAHLLSTTLHHSSFLRSHIRRLKILHEPASILIYEWFRDLPPNGLRHLEVFQGARDTEFARLILRSPVTRSIRSLILRGWFFDREPMALGICLGIPDLEALSLKFPNPSVTLDLTCVPPVRLKRLSISTYSFSPEILALLAIVGPTLEQFDFNSVSWDYSIPELAAALVLHAPQVRHLSIQGVFTQHTPFLDDLVPSLPFLSYLYCGYGTYSPAIFSRIPQGLQSLRLQGPPHFPITDISAIAKAIKNIEPHKELDWLIINWDQIQNLVDLDDIRAACEETGIRFTCWRQRCIDLLK